MEITKEQLEKWTEKLNCVAKEVNFPSFLLREVIIEMQSMLYKTQNVKCKLCMADAIDLGIYEERRYYRCEDCNWVTSIRVEKIK